MKSLQGHDKITLRSLGRNDFFGGCARSSGGQSRGFLNPVPGVRVLPGAPIIPPSTAGVWGDLLVATEDHKWMALAIAEAQTAFQKGEVPVGAVVVRDGKVLGSGHNLREARQDPTAHAELIALQQASQALNSWRLTGATIYVTLEPCPMVRGDRSGQLAAWYMGQPIRRREQLRPSTILSRTRG